MDPLSIRGGMKAFIEALAIECRDDWSKWLTEDELQAVKDALAAFGDEEIKFMETGWNPDKQDRLENEIRELVDDMINNVQNKGHDSTGADDNADTYEDLFDRIKITVCDGPEGDRGAYTLMGVIEEKRSPDNDKAAVEFTIETDDTDFQVSYPWGMLNDPEVDGENAQDGPLLGGQGGEPVVVEEEEARDTIVVRPLPASQQGDDEGMADHSHDDSDAGGSSPVSHQEGCEGGLGDVVMESIERDVSTAADDDSVIEYVPSEGDDDASLAGPSNDQEMGEKMVHHHDDSGDDDYDPDAVQPVDMEDDDDSDYLDDPKGKKPQKAKAKRTAYSLQNYYQSNDLWDVVFDADKPNGPPVGYRCKIASCNNWQGKYGGRHSHFQSKHPKEWFALTGKEVKVHKCLEDGCGWSSRHGSGASYLRKHMKERHRRSGAKKNKK